MKPLLLLGLWLTLVSTCLLRPACLPQDVTEMGRCSTDPSLAAADLPGQQLTTPAADLPAEDEGPATRAAFTALPPAPPARTQRASACPPPTHACIWVPPPRA